MSQNPHSNTQSHPCTSVKTFPTLPHMFQHYDSRVYIVVLVLRLKVCLNLWWDEFIGHFNMDMPFWTLILLSGVGSFQNKRGIATFTCYFRVDLIWVDRDHFLFLTKKQEYAGQRKKRDERAYESTAVSSRYLARKSLLLLLRLGNENSSRNEQSLCGVKMVRMLSLEYACHHSKVNK